MNGQTEGNAKPRRLPHFQRVTVTLFMHIFLSIDHLEFGARRKSWRSRAWRTKRKLFAIVICGQRVFQHCDQGVRNCLRGDKILGLLPQTFTQSQTVLWVSSARHFILCIKMLLHVCAISNCRYIVLWSFGLPILSFWDESLIIYYMNQMYAIQMKIMSYRVNVFHYFKIVNKIVALLWL